MNEGYFFSVRVPALIFSFHLLISAMLAFEIFQLETSKMDMGCKHEDYMHFDEKPFNREYCNVVDGITCVIS